tara:strand:- start:200 stop:1564 length:1365 start_codon:yes stop_codon:yes gene_type:complete
MTTKIKYKKKILIVGGGYIGTLTSLLFSQKDDFEVTLVEKQNRLGGLYNSAWEYGEYCFDYGSRSIVQTNIKDIDNLLWEILPKSVYPRSKKNLKEFSFQKGKLREYSNCLDARLLEIAEKKIALKQMKEIKKSDILNKNLKNLESFCKAIYGESLTLNLIKPAIEKLTGINMIETDPCALFAHNLNRLIIANQIESKKLKSKNVFNDNRIAFSQYDDHVSDLVKMYPRKGGLRDFGKRLHKYLSRRKNVTIKLENTVNNILSEGNLIKSVLLKDKTILQPDIIIWTIPPIFLSKILRLDSIASKSNEFRNLILSHYVLEGKIKTKAYYLYNYDPQFKNYRTTVYQNFSCPSDKLKSITVESFCDEINPELDYFKNTLFDEIKKMDIISSESKIIDNKIHIQKNAIPKYSLKFTKNQNQIFDNLNTKYKNLMVFGNIGGSKSSLNHAYKIYQEL